MVNCSGAAPPCRLQAKSQPQPRWAAPVVLAPGTVPGSVRGSATAAAAAGLRVGAAPGQIAVVAVHQETLLHRLVPTAETIGWQICKKHPTRSYNHGDPAMCPAAPGEPPHPPMGASSVDLSLSLSELELGRGLRPRFRCRWEDSMIGSWGGPMGLFPCPGVIWLSRFFGGRPGRFGGPAVLGFFLEKSTEVLLPTSWAGVEEELGPRPGRQRRRHQLQPTRPGRDHMTATPRTALVSQDLPQKILHPELCHVCAGEVKLSGLLTAKVRWEHQRTPCQPETLAFPRQQPHQNRSHEQAAGINISHNMQQLRSFNAPLKDKGPKTLPACRRACSSQCLVGQNWAVEVTIPQ